MDNPENPKISKVPDYLKDFIWYKKMIIFEHYFKCLRNN